MCAGAEEGAERSHYKCDGGLCTLLNLLTQCRNEACSCAQVLKKELNAPTYRYDSGLRDQNAITYVLKQEWAEQQSHVLLVNKQYCLNCYWRDLLNNDLKSDDTKVSCYPGLAQLEELPLDSGAAHCPVSHA